jgi:hypothetical protein
MSNENGTAWSRSPIRASARCETAIGDMPGGAASAFWVHE